MRLFVTLAFAAGLYGQQQPFDVAAMLRLARIGEPALSPDGKTVAFTVQTVDIEQNTKPKQIYVVGLNGGFPRQITREGTDNERPRWSPDSRQIYFISNRGGSSQVWVMDADGGHPRLITRLATEAAGVLVSADGKRIVFQSSVYPECGADNSCNQKNL